MSRSHFRRYAIEGSSLGLFMISAAVFTIFFEYPTGIGRIAFENALLRRAMIGAGMGLTAILIIYSRWGRESGAHMNPAVTLTFLSLGKISKFDAVGYIFSQFIGAMIGIAFLACLIPQLLFSPLVNGVVTVPGDYSLSSVFLAEFGVAFTFMFEVLFFSNIKRIAQFTGLIAGVLIALFVTFEGPISGMSMNPARTFASALVTQNFTAIWIYFTAPVSGMLIAGFIYSRVFSPPRHAKLHPSESELN
jgi:aquaporin Z